MATKIKREKFVTPIGVVKFAHLLAPNKRFNVDGEFSVDLLLDPANPAVPALRKLIEGLTAKAKADAVANAVANAKDGKTAKALQSYSTHVPIEVDVDKDGNETGMLVLKAKQKAVIKIEGKPDIQKTVAMFDAKGQPVKGKNPGRGSKLKVSVTVNPYVAIGLKQVGVSLWLDAVQILELKEFGRGDADSYGFAAEEGGYVDDGEAPSEDAPAPTENDAAPSEDNPDFG